MFLGVAMADSKEKKHPKDGGVVKPKPKPTLKPEPEPDCVTEPEQPESACNIMCTMEYRPQCCLPVNQCGDFKNFGNPCAVGVWNCQNPNDRKCIHSFDIDATLLMQSFFCLF